ncbi:putative nucleoside diphosphate phosphatase [Rosa chinensis]|uniref:Putative nucleoside diphosphate phosphatase n=1 Tax=Rosa chinensis TaxID=74649 RepID=A0A2P6P5Q7_ROSCH|nr:probable apyrase 7 [Rosa chinensis]XP_024170281.1 probable apyrase 7 [Rosa chinensis]PRQ17271.1 putative nucleoside diphosphate phosphatase [Rosa chinensis]
MEPKSPSKLKLSSMGFTQHKQALKTTILVLVTGLLLLGVYFAFESGRGHGVSKGPYYTVVVDCGSTGTRVNVYEWLVEESNKELPILLYTYPDNSTEGKLLKSCKYHCLQTEPGLDKFVGNLSGIRASLEPLITWAEHKVPVERHDDTPIFVLATAGLRRLPVEDARRVLDDVDAVVKQHSFFHKKSWIRVLSGKEEAYYGWVALNYKMGSFRNHSRLPTLGLVDLGGSSLQVVVENEDAREDTHLVRSKFGFVEHNILAYSLPAFGLNEAFDRTVVMLSNVEQLRESRVGKLEIRHPCLSSDIVQNYTCSGCFQPNAGGQENMTSKVQETKLSSVYLVGEQNWEQCRRLARAAAMSSSTPDSARCSDRGSDIINLTAVAHPTAHFHALSGFFAVYDKLNLSSRATLTKIWEKGQQLCSRSWTNLSQNGYYAWQYCFRVPYMASLIEDALCLGDKEIIFGPGDVSWTLGAALVEGEYLWLSTTRSQISISNFCMKVVSLPIFVLVSLLCLLFIVYFSKVKLPMIGSKVADRASLSVRGQKMMD